MSLAMSTVVEAEQRGGGGVYRYIPKEVLSEEGGAIRAVSAEVTKEGFHRELQLRFVFDVRSLRQAMPLNNELVCQTTLLLPMPNSVYLDRYQLFDLHRKSLSSSADTFNTNPEVLLLDDVDLEKPAFMVNSSLALVHHEFRFSPQLLAEGSRMEGTLKIPFHIRYQLPDKGRDKYRTDRLSSIEQVFINCASAIRSSASSSSSLSRPLPSNICSKLAEKRQDIPSDLLPRADELCSSTSSSSLTLATASTITTSFKSERLEFTVPVGDVEQAETLTQLTAGCYSIVALLLSGYVWSVWDHYRTLLSSSKRRS